jgi:hypothetical protein
MIADRLSSLTRGGLHEFERATFRHVVAMTGGPKRPLAPQPPLHT